MTSIHFTTHYNWAWVVAESLNKLKNCQNVEVVSSSSFKALPSQVNDLQTKPSYALFRVDVVSKSNSVTQVRMTSQSFAHLDPKDALYKQLKALNIEFCMPTTHLIEWDNESQIDEKDFPSYPALLKAALGSGGFGLYFVYTSQDILEVIKGHKTRAERSEGFLEGLRRDYGSVPDWSLQQLVPSVRISAKDNRRCQIRAYAVECNGQIYLYDGYEVRLPGWDIDLDAVLARELADSKSPDSHDNCKSGRWTDEVELECCGEGYARPYNEKRNKSMTERYLIEEVDELKPLGVRRAIHSAVRVCMSAIKPDVQRRSTGPVSLSPNATPSTLAIVGIDLLVSREEGDAAEGSGDGYRAYIVEMNNNPAMPAENKHMSPLYRQHLVDMVSCIVALGARTAGSGDGLSCNTGSGDEFVDSIATRCNLTERFELL